MATVKLLIIFFSIIEFYTLLPPSLHTKLDQMPRQAVYSLASRAGSLERKEDDRQKLSRTAETRTPFFDPSRVSAGRRRQTTSPFLAACDQFLKKVA